MNGVLFDQRFFSIALEIAIVFLQHRASPPYESLSIDIFIMTNRFQSIDIAFKQP